MGEWSDYFEDFPEENPGNYVGNQYNPEGAKALAKQQAQVAHAQANLNAEISAIVAKHKKPSEPTA